MRSVVTMRRWRAAGALLVASIAVWSCQSEAPRVVAALELVPARLEVVTQPSGAVPGAILNVQPVVQIQDPSDKPVTTSTAQVTATLATGVGTLSGTTTVSAVNGVATFM